MKFAMSKEFESQLQEIKNKWAKMQEEFVEKELTPLFNKNNIFTANLTNYEYRDENYQYYEMINPDTIIETTIKGFDKKGNIKVTAKQIENGKCIGMYTNNISAILDDILVYMVGSLEGNEHFMNDPTIKIKGRDY